MSEARYVTQKQRSAAIRCGKTQRRACLNVPIQTDCLPADTPTRTGERIAIDVAGRCIEGINAIGTFAESWRGIGIGWLISAVVAWWRLPALEALA